MARTNCGRVRQLRIELGTQFLDITNGYHYRRTGANTYDIRTVANLKSDLGLKSLAYLDSLLRHDRRNWNL